MSKSTDNHLKEDNHIFVKPGKKISIDDYDTKYKADFKDKDDDPDFAGYYHVIEKGSYIHPRGYHMDRITVIYIN